MECLHERIDDEHISRYQALFETAYERRTRIYLEGEHFHLGLDFHRVEDLLLANKRKSDERSTSLIAPQLRHTHTIKHHAAVMQQLKDSTMASHKRDERSRSKIAPQLENKHYTDHYPTVMQQLQDMTMVFPIWTLLHIKHDRKKKKNQNAITRQLPTSQLHEHEGNNHDRDVCHDAKCVPGTKNQRPSIATQTADSKTNFFAQKPIILQKPNSRTKTSLLCEITSAKTQLYPFDNPRYRESCSDPPLGDGSDLDLAGQASVNDTKTPSNNSTMNEMTSNETTCTTSYTTI